MIEEVADRHARAGSQPFGRLSLTQSARRVWAGWDLIHHAGETDGAVFVFARAGHWAAFGISWGCAGRRWESLGHVARWTAFHRPLREDRVLTAALLPDLLDAMAAQARGNAFSVWVDAAAAVWAGYEGPDRETTEFLVGLGGCAELMRLLRQRHAAYAQLREELHAKQEVSTAQWQATARAPQSGPKP